MYPKTPLKFFLHYLKFYRKWAIVSLAFIFLGTLASNLSPYYFSRIINTISDFSGDKTDIWSFISYDFCLFVGMALCAILFSCLEYYFQTDRIGTELPVQVQKELTDYVMHHSATYFMNTPSGKISAKIEQAAGATGILIWKFISIFRGIFEAIITLGVLLVVSPLLAGVAFVWLFIIAFILLWSGKMIQFTAEHYFNKCSNTTGCMIDMISNNLLIKSFSNFLFESERLSRFLRIEKRADKKWAKTSNYCQTVQLTLVVLFEVSMIVLSLFMWINGHLMIGDIVLVLVLVTSLSAFFDELVWELVEYHKEIGTLRSALEIMIVPHGIEDTPNAKPISNPKGEIEFRHVYFAHDGRQPLFRNLSLHIKAGERVGLVGVSGSGKSTFVNLLLRFFETAKGDILIDGQNIKTLTQDSLHKNISVIPQDTSLFHRSLLENIAYGDINSSKRRIIRAAKESFAHDFIVQTPRKYNTLVGDRGVKLSGGQRQRIALARAFLKNAPILIFDEATSALDAESEKFIQDSMHQLIKHKTVIIIAHRLSTLKEMDRIIVFKHGRIIEEGTADKLLKSKGQYAKLWKMQIMGQLTKQKRKKHTPHLT